MEMVYHQLGIQVEDKPCPDMISSKMMEKRKELPVSPCFTYCAVNEFPYHAAVDSRVRLPGLLCQSIFSLPSAVCTSARHSSLVDPPGLLVVRIVAPVITTIDYNH